MIHGIDHEKIGEAIARMEREALGIGTTSDKPAPVLTLEGLEAAMRSVDPDGRMVAEAALLGRLRRHPVSMTKLLAGCVPEVAPEVSRG